MTRRGSRAAVAEATLLTGIKQGAAGAVQKAFGCETRSNRRRKAPQQKKRGKGKGGRGMGRGNQACLDAFAPMHMPLPRAVAPYTVIRTTAVWNADSTNGRKFNLFGPIMDTRYDAGQWSSRYAIGMSGLSGLDMALNTDNGTHMYAFDTLSDATWKAASVTPAAFSIQIMNPEQLQQTNGIVYIGRAKNKVALSEGDLTRTWRKVADSLVSYCNPRLCAAGKLALRGVQVDATPNNMSELAKFTTLAQEDSASFKLGTDNTSHQEGFNPIFVYNPNGIDLQILVCCEWRVRFDPGNPAHAACSMKKPTTEASWAKMIEDATKLGNGVIDIAEKVANLGERFNRRDPGAGILVVD
jgi:hypothetical protein